MRPFAVRCRELATRILTELKQSTVGCYAVGEYHAPHAEKQLRAGRTSGGGVAHR